MRQKVEWVALPQSDKQPPKDDTTHTNNTALPPAPPQLAPPSSHASERPLTTPAWRLRYRTTSRTSSSSGMVRDCPPATPPCTPRPFLTRYRARRHRIDALPPTPARDHRQCLAVLPQRHHQLPMYGVVSAVCCHAPQPLTTPPSRVPADRVQRREMRLPAL